nr:class I SAM-dependent methyltransferase [Actinospica robiniae]
MFNEHHGERGTCGESDGGAGLPGAGGRGRNDGGAGRFSDPVAARLLRVAERTAVEEVRAGAAPKGWQARASYESVRACAEIVVPRTIAIDEALRARATGQLVILGAGLDTRAWRLAGLERTDVWEVDHPASQQDKRARLAEAAQEARRLDASGDAAEELPSAARSVRFAPVDFALDDLGEALDSAGHDPSAPTTWLWEGVVPYLTRAEMQATLVALVRRSAPGSSLILNYQAPSAKAAAGRLLTRVIGSSATSGEPWRSLWKPNRMAVALGQNGLQMVSDDDLLGIARSVGGSVRLRTSLRSGRVAVAERPRAAG